MEALRIERIIRQMCYFDALIMPGMRLEYLQPAFDPKRGLGGFDYYKLIAPVGSYVVHVRSPRVLQQRQHQIAERLVQLGVQARALQLVEWGAVTAPDAPRWRLPHLLALDAERILLGA